jgi:hypothetical protein
MYLADHFRDTGHENPDLSGKDRLQRPALSVMSALVEK